jgi:predicted nucleic acid-binding Zn ribbon protein
MTGPRSLATILPGLLTRLGLAETAAGWRAVSEWPAVAGARIARRTRAVSFRDGTLSVEVEGSAWMHELGFLRRELVRNLNRHLDAEVVRDVRFVPAGPRPRGTGARPSGWAGGSLR